MFNFVSFYMPFFFSTATFSADSNVAHNELANFTVSELILKDYVICEIFLNLYQNHKYGRLVDYFKIYFNGNSNFHLLASF